MKTIFTSFCVIATSMALFGEVRTDCYWHWMNGNISKEGITADLEYMKVGGIEAAMIFDVGIGVKRGKVDYAGAEWKDCVAWASREAERLGIELSLHNSPGYSACGGPWIAPEESMKELVWRVEKFKVQSLKYRGANAKLGYYREIARYPLATADETIGIDRRLEKGESAELALDGEKEVAALNVWRGEREKPLDPFDGPRDYGCTLKVEAFDGAAWRAVGDVRCPTFRSFTSRPTIQRSRWVRSARASTAPTAHPPRCGGLPTTSSKGKFCRWISHAEAQRVSSCWLSARLCLPPHPRIFSHGH